ncbi:MAG: aminotransferase class III-fold pyridoxal phosphate-dependent enzyme [Proteobacteria bacterium]|nr:aminotransferase class III-fold pyridoxal phosphate-dependent enzyme [Pseudomonadota bacterium]
MSQSDAAPRFTIDEAAAFLFAHYGMKAELSPLPSERDQNFHVVTPDGAGFTLKIANSGEPAESLAFQNALLAHFEAAAPDLSAPRLVPGNGGERMFKVKGAEGAQHALRLVTYLAGQPMAQRQVGEPTLRDLGATLGRFARALQGFGHPGAHRAFDWDIRETPRARARLGAIADAARRDRIAAILDRFDAHVAPALPKLPAGVIHNDANDWNILLDADGRVSGLIDFGDALHGPRVAELAVALAYAMLDRENPVLAVAPLVAGFHTEMPLSDAEFAVLPDLVAARLAISVTLSAMRAREAEDNPYLLVSEKPAWALIEILSGLDNHIVSGIWRHACGLEAAPGARRVIEWLARHRAGLPPVMHPHPARAKKGWIDFATPGSPLVVASATHDHAGAARLYDAQQAEQGFELGMGPWGEVRYVYSAPFFASKLIAGERRRMHLGLDIFAPAGTEMFTPLDGTVVGLTINPDPLDYGGLIMLAHEPEPGLRFLSLWGHLSHESVRVLSLGQKLKAGDRVAWLGDFPENGGWLPHIHLQLVVPPYADPSIVPGVGEAALEPVWAELYPHAYDFAGLPAETFDKSGRPKEVLLAARKGLLGPNLSISYSADPLKIVRGEDVWLIDADGRAYLDCYNNVAHVGHCHPRVVRAIQQQVGRLNTNTRYLHDNIVTYAERLKALMPAGLDTFYFTASGSEANEVAIRMARAFTGRRDMLVIDWAYHGTTQTLIDISPYKYKRKGGAGRPAGTHELPLPETYRAPADWAPAQIGPKYAAMAGEIIDTLVAQKRVPAAFIAETIPSVAGQVFLPEGYMAEVYRQARAAGIVCIADEVQVGFGRVGDAMWAFEEHGVVPDIVTMGKPVGAGHPMGVVAVRREIAEAFANGMEYFNTFGGNPVSCAAGLAVLDVLEDEKLLANAAREGQYLLEAFRALMAEDAGIGDVRGRGLFLGIEMVKDRLSKAHDGARAGAAVMRMRDLGVLAGTDGPHDNVIKLRPPMTFRRAHSDLLIGVLTQALRETRR